MAETTLVNSDIEVGRELVRILDEGGFPVTGAAWIYFPDDQEWRLVIRTPEAAKNLLDAYSEMARAMDAKGDLRERLDLTRVKLVPPTDKMLAAIGKAVQVQGLSQIRFSRNVINGMYIDDALIYRLAA
ncbi:MAG: hypothetical protein QOC56_1245 [Alphaproteobacteria bacterium]|jgi:hypothetical protein|nr:hypothetical protein [Alphaproteobacteria bacterium]